MTESVGIGAATETPAPPVVREAPHWVQITCVDKMLMVACMRCVVHETVNPNGQALNVVAEISHIIRKHSLCSSFREAL